MDHDSAHDDIRAFLGRLKTALEARDLMLLGLTTDGSALYPKPLAEIFMECRIKTVRFMSQSRWSKRCWVSSPVSKSLAAKQLTLPKRRPTTKAAKAAARKKKRLAQQCVDLYTHRHLCVQHHLSHSERKRLWRITRGLPQWRKLRELMAQVYALFDRCCRTQTALDKLDNLALRPCVTGALSAAPSPS